MVGNHAVSSPSPQRPSQLPVYSEACLQALVERGLAQQLSLVSIELLQAGRKVFSFQIAQRSAQLKPSIVAPWIDVPLDSFPDLVASKMVALVERGAPRDFRDIYAVCMAGLSTPDGCWSLWRQRQALADSDTDMQRARLAIITHLARIIQHRRLDQIADPLNQEQAAQIRTWFMDTFLSETDDFNRLA